MVFDGTRRSFAHSLRWFSFLFSMRADFDAHNMMAKAYVLARGALTGFSLRRFPGSLEQNKISHDLLMVANRIDACASTLPFTACGKRHWEVPIGTIFLCVRTGPSRCRCRRGRRQGWLVFGPPRRAARSILDGREQGGHARLRPVTDHAIRVSCWLDDPSGKNLVASW